MEPARLVDALDTPDAFPRPADDVEVVQTHISIVFLVGDRAYKVKKPVEMDFIDYSTLQKRHHFCRREVELNRRLAPEVYRGVRPIVERDGRLQIATSLRDDEEALDWAVEMKRLPEWRTLESRLAAGDLPDDVFARLGARLADFHDEATRSDEIAEYGRFEVVAGHARDNYDQSEDQVGTTIHPDVFERLVDLNERELNARRDLIERRAEANVPCDTHGDLRLDHVYLYPEREPPHDLVIVDCIEFNPSFRYADPVSDMAFLTMDLAYHGHREHAETFADHYFECAGDPEGRELLDFHVAYRAAVRGKVEGIEAGESEISEEQRRRAARSATGHWLLALGRLETPAHRPALVMVGGLPGTGKSTLAHRLGERADFEVVDSDVVRKRLAGLEPSQPADEAVGEGIYTDEWSERTYEACLEQVEELLFRGDRALVEASFADAERRRRFLETAQTLGVSARFLICEADSETVRDRLADREGDVSDADWSVYQHMADDWDPLDAAMARRTSHVDTERPPEATADAALDLLRDADLY